MPTRTRVLLAFLMLALSASCGLLMYVERARLADYGKLDLLLVIRREFSGFLSAYAWQKMDFYGHFGEWVEQKGENGEVQYMSIFKYQEEYLPITRFSVELDPSFVERVAIVGNNMATSLEMPEEGISLMQRAILQNRENPRLYRLYGEVGLIHFQVLKNPQAALRWFAEVRHFLKNLPLEQWEAQDAFHIRLYGLYAALAALELEQIELAFDYWKFSRFEPGPSILTQLLGPLKTSLPLELWPQWPPQLSSTQKAFLMREGLLDSQEPETEKPDDHDHADHDHQGHNHEGHDHEGLFFVNEEELRHKLAKEELTRRMEEVFLSLVPQLRSSLFFPIGWNLAFWVWLGAILCFSFLYRLSQAAQLPKEEKTHGKNV